METKKRCTALTVILAVSAAVFAVAETADFVSFLDTVRLLSMWNVGNSVASSIATFIVELVSDIAIFVLLSVFFCNTKNKGLYIVALTVYAAFRIYCAAIVNAITYKIYMLVFALAAVLFIVNTFMNNKMLTACRISSAALLAVSSVSAVVNIIGKIMYSAQSGGIPSPNQIISIITALILNFPIIPLTLVLYYFVFVRKKPELSSQNNADSRIQA
ncbi:MAG: hypothetical protein ACI3YE_07000 [Candidatus Avispirillum sp.]